MPLAAYPDVSFFVRAVHVLPVIAVAAAVGGIIGGFTVYAVDSALTWPQPSSQRPTCAPIISRVRSRPPRWKRKRARCASSAALFRIRPPECRRRRRRKAGKALRSKA